MIALNPNAPVLDDRRPLDLRRRPSREFAETMARRAESLEADERELIRAVYRDGLSARRVAQIRNQSPRVVCKRVRRCVERMVSPEFVYVFERSARWPTMKRRIARTCILQGKSMRATADELQLSIHLVRRHVQAIREAAEGGVQ